MPRGDIYQVGSRRCGCVDCAKDYPPAQYGYRPDRDGCLGPWRARHCTPEGKQQQKTFRSRADAVLFLRTQAVTHGA